MSYGLKIGLLVIGMACAPKVHAEEALSPLILGVGNWACTSWIEDPDTSNGLAALHWAMGALSGINMASEIETGPLTAEFVLVWIRSYCTSNPSSSIAGAVTELYAEILDERAELLERGLRILENSN